MIFETIRIALGSLSANKMRTFLSMLGIIIGVGAVIAIVSIGSGAQNQVTGQISGLGSNLITIRPGYSRGGGGRVSSVADNVFTLELADEIAKSCPGVKNVIPNLQGSGLLIAKDTNIVATLVGTSPEYQDLNKYYPLQGGFLSSEALAEVTNVIVLGSSLAEDLFPDANPLGERVKFSVGKNLHLFTVIGVMEEKGSGLMGDYNSQAYIPITTYMQKIANTRYVNSYLAQAESSEEATSAVQEIEYFLDIYLGDSDKYMITSQDQILDTLNQVTGTLSLMLAGIAGISLLVGGIGIMNIMLVSVTERTREIGIRKALGAKSKHVLSQFLIEALSLSGVGGVIGILLGSLGAAGIAQIADWELVVPISSVLLSFCFALMIGLFFGIYPAMKAAKLDPVDALSYE